ncbi:bidirectional sugar transporter SWEET14-like [Aristolochia californica]|uniref:bidirectional sugar transporter SWEET14-like n=1 Tax=Aristolochia californica TaxID=171875 RepID=UPI0035DED9F9
MATFSTHHPLAFAFGLLGNLVSFTVYLAPVPTFYKIYKKKSTEGFQSVPYVVALCSAMLWIYYAFTKKDDHLLITINSVGCVIETIYIVTFIFYASKKAKIFTAKLLLLLNIGVFGTIVLITLLLSRGSLRERVLGWVCLSFSVSVFAAPLSIMRLVIQTRSVEFMPFTLSFFLTLSAVMWFFYGLLLKDLFIALPNVIGFVLGLLQMILYSIYRKSKKVIAADKLPEYISDIVTLSRKGSWEVQPTEVQEMNTEKELEEDLKFHDIDDHKNSLSCRIEAQKIEGVV